MTNWMKTLAGIGVERQTVFFTYLGLAVGWVCACCLIVLYQTVMPHEPPVEYGDGKIAAWVDRDNDSLIISYTRPVTPRHDIKGVEILRSINCKDRNFDQTFDLPVLVRNYTVDKPQNVNRLVTYPYPMPVGAKCEMATMVQWTPMLSVNKHSWSLPKVPFIVGDRPQDVRSK